MKMEESSEDALVLVVNSESVLFMFIILNSMVGLALHQAYFPPHTNPTNPSP